MYGQPQPQLTQQDQLVLNAFNQLMQSITNGNQVRTVLLHRLKMNTQVLASMQMMAITIGRQYVQVGLNFNEFLQSQLPRYVEMVYCHLLYSAPDQQQGLNQEALGRMQTNATVYNMLINNQLQISPQMFNGVILPPAPMMAAPVMAGMVPQASIPLSSLGGNNPAAGSIVIAGHLPSEDVSSPTSGQFSVPPSERRAERKQGTPVQTGLYMDTTLPEPIQEQVVQATTTDAQNPPVGKLIFTNLIRPPLVELGKYIILTTPNEQQLMGFHYDVHEAVNNVEYEAHRISHFIKPIRKPAGIPLSELTSRFYQQADNAGLSKDNLTIDEIIDQIKARSTEMPVNILKELDGQHVFEDNLNVVLKPSQHTYSSILDGIREDSNIAFNETRGDGKLGTFSPLTQSIVIGMEVVWDGVVIRGEARELIEGIADIETLVQFRDILAELEDHFSPEYWARLHQRSITCIDRILKEQYGLSNLIEPIVDSILNDTDDLIQYLHEVSRSNNKRGWGNNMINACVAALKHVWSLDRFPAGVTAILTELAQEVDPVGEEDEVAFFCHVAKYAAIPVSSLNFAFTSSGSRYALVSNDTLPEFWTILNRVDSSLSGLITTNEFTIYFNDGERLSVMRDMTGDDYIVSNIGVLP